MSKFTSGKWRAGEHSPLMGISIFATGRPFRIARLEGYYPVEEEEANARLIAAAPEMYELLKDVAQWQGNYVWDTACKAKELLARINREEGAREDERNGKMSIMREQA